MFTHRLGPLPMWLWVVIIGAVIVGWSLYKSRTSGGGSQQQDTTGTDTPASDVPQFVNQTYTTVQAPNVQDNDDTGPVRVGPHPPEPPMYHPPTPKPPVRKPVPPKPHVPPIFNSTYIVKKGETLNSLAARFHVTRTELAHANGLGTGAGLRTGQKLKVPNPAGYGKPNKAA